MMQDAKSEITRLQERVKEMEKSLGRLYEDVNALGGHRPTERNYDQGYVDGIDAALTKIDSARAIYNPSGGQ